MATTNTTNLSKEEISLKEFQDKMESYHRYIDWDTQTLANKLSERSEKEIKNFLRNAMYSSFVCLEALLKHRVPHNEITQESIRATSLDGDTMKEVLRFWNRMRMLEYRRFTGMDEPEMAAFWEENGRTDPDLTDLDLYSEFLEGNPKPPAEILDDLEYV